MKTLYEKVTNQEISRVDAAAISSQLLQMIAEGSICTHLDPRRVLIDASNIVSLDRAPRHIDCSYAAPEIVVGGGRPTKMSMLFSLGCILDFMLNGQNFYTRCEEDPILMCSIRPGSCLISTEHAEVPEEAAVAGLTDWVPARREAGVRALRSFMMRNTGSIGSHASSVPVAVPVRRQMVLKYLDPRGNTVSEPIFRNMAASGHKCFALNAFRPVSYHIFMAEYSAADELIQEKEQVIFTVPSMSDGMVRLHFCNYIQPRGFTIDICNQQDQPVTERKSYQFH